jgi:hypothetical protein
MTRRTIGRTVMIVAGLVSAAISEAHGDQKVLEAKLGRLADKFGEDTVQDAYVRSMHAGRTRWRQAAFEEEAVKKVSTRRLERGEVIDLDSELRSQVEVDKVLLRARAELVISKEKSLERRRKLIALFKKVYGEEPDIFPAIKGRVS